ncbi:MAG: DUF5131 family protein [Caldilineales bacterium]|nr:DUF5131 family protein [Caldilineales bacterium]
MGTHCSEQASGAAGWAASTNRGAGPKAWQQVVLGGEPGPGARPLHPAWVTQVRDQCQRQRVPFFFKQWGGVRKKQNGRLLAGRTWDEMPAPALTA